MSTTHNRYDINCHSCGNPSIVVTEPDANPPPSFCPICGEKQEQEAEGDSSGD